MDPVGEPTQEELRARLEALRLEVQEFRRRRRWMLWVGGGLIIASTPTVVSGFHHVAHFSWFWSVVTPLGFLAVLGIYVEIFRRTYDRK